MDGPSNSDWRNYKEKLAVVGILFRVGETSHPFIEKIRPYDFGEIETLKLSELFCSQSDQESYYHYKGSLTNPPCADVVNWILHKEVLTIS